MTPQPRPMFDDFSEQYFRLLENLNQAVIGTDTEGKVILWSDEAEALYGWARDEVIGRSILEITPSDVSRADAAEIMTTLAAGRVWSGTFTVRSRTNQSFEVSVTDVPLIDAGERVVGIIGVSAAAERITQVNPTMNKLREACNLVWPGLVSISLADDAPAVITASEPHVIQLLALIISRFAEVLKGGTHLDISLRPASGSPFTDFDLASSTDSGVYIQLCERREPATFSVMRGLIRHAEPTEFAAVLVRMVGGYMMRGATGVGAPTIHLLLPSKQQSRRA